MQTENENKFLENNVVIKLDKSQKSLISAFKVLKACTRDEPSRYQMNGVFYDHKTRELRSTDTKRLFVLNYKLPEVYDQRIFSIDIVKTNVFLYDNIDGIFPDCKKAVDSIEKSPSIKQLESDKLNLINAEMFISSICNEIYKINNEPIIFNSALTKELFKLLELYSIFSVSYIDNKRPIVIKTDNFTFLQVPILSR